MTRDEYAAVYRLLGLMRLLCHSLSIDVDKAELALTMEHNRTKERETETINIGESMADVDAVLRRYEASEAAR